MLHNDQLILNCISVLLTLSDAGLSCEGYLPGGLLASGNVCEGRMQLKNAPKLPSHWKIWVGAVSPSMPPPKGRPWRCGWISYILGETDWRPQQKQKLDYKNGTGWNCHLTTFLWGLSLIQGWEVSLSHSHVMHLTPALQNCQIIWWNYGKHELRE